MPELGPLGRLVKHHRTEMKLTQLGLSDRTGQYGVRVPQNDISRLESGKTQRMNNHDFLDSLAKALGFADQAVFILAAYRARIGPELAMIEAMGGWTNDEKWRAVRHTSS